MDDPVAGEITRFLNAASKGDPAAREQLAPLIYQELRALAGRQYRGQGRDLTLQPTDLVHEAFARLVKIEATWESRTHFFSVAATAMRRILVDHARARKAEKRGAGHQPLDIDELAVAFEERSVDLVKLDDALTKLSTFDPMKSKLVELRFFGGLTIPDAAGHLGMSRATAERAWALARAWLHREIVAG